MDDYSFIIDVKDKRNEYLMQNLAKDGFIVEEYNSLHKSNLSNVIYVFAPSTVIDIKIADSIIEGSYILCLKCDIQIDKYLSSKNVKVLKLFDDELLAAQNAYITAEGAISYIINNTSISLRRNNTLVLGYGRVGKAMTQLLSALGANVYVATNDLNERAIACNIADYVCDLSNCKKHLAYFKVIVNTVPAMVLEEYDLMKLNNGCFVLDLASLPGGVDYKVAKELNINVIHALGIPGLSAPETAAEQLEESIYRIINEKIKV